MAGSIASLNFKFTADIKGVQKAMRDAEKSLRAATSSFSQIGNQMSLALSAPIAGFVAMAVKAGGEMESLKLAMRSTFAGAGRSISEADAELEKLREAALAPGLDFKQAVQGSLRLQGVGKSAEESRRIIVQLANALASVGGTAEQLDGVTHQFAQMIGKGKVMQEDLRVILENMPNLAKVMRDEFGATTAEGLRDLGVSADQFVTRLTNKLETLPRVSGGISNSLVNLGSAFQQSLAKVGEELNKTFNITGKLDKFADWISGAAEAFSHLSEGTKRAIAAVATFAFTLGPLLKAMQPVVWIVGQLQIGYIALQKALLQSINGTLPSLAARWRALDAVMKASVIGATVAVVLALGAAFLVLQKDMSAAAQAQRAVENVHTMAAASISVERANIELLTKVAKDEKKSKDERLGAMKELIAINPEYAKALDKEAINTQILEKTTNALVASMLRAATARRAIDEIAAIDDKLRELKKNSDPSFLQSFGNALISWGRNGDFVNKQIATTLSNYEEQRAALLKTREELEKVAQANVHVFGTTETVTNKNKDEGDSLDDLIKKYLELDKATKLANRQKQTKDLGAFKATVSPQIETPNLIPENLQSESPFDKIRQSVQDATVAIKEHLTVSQQIGATYDEIQKHIIPIGDALSDLSQKFLLMGYTGAAAALAAADAMAKAADSGETSLAKLALAAVAAAAKVIRAQIQEAVTAAALSALKSIPFPFNIAAAAAAGAGAAALFNGLIKSIGIPALADGGVATGPTVALVGEYANARTNPEIIAPENKLRNIFRGELRGSGAGGTLSARVSGRDLLFVLEQAGYDAKRTRGR